VLRRHAVTKRIRRDIENEVRSGDLESEVRSSGEEGEVLMGGGIMMIDMEDMTDVVTAGIRHQGGSGGNDMSMTGGMTVETEKNLEGVRIGGE
jgi:hypothetical protein